MEPPNEQSKSTTSDPASLPSCLSWKRIRNVFLRSATDRVVQSREAMDKWRRGRADSTPKRDSAAKQSVPTTLRRSSVPCSGATPDFSDHRERRIGEEQRAYRRSCCSCS